VVELELEHSMVKELDLFGLIKFAVRDMRIVCLTALPAVLVLRTVPMLRMHLLFAQHVSYYTRVDDACIL
jgi:hypothetical protein